MLGYLIWRIFRIMSRTGGSSRGYGDVHEPPGGLKKDERKITDIKDADFEEVPPSETDKD